MPLDWAQTQNNLSNALFRLGEGQSGTARLEEAVRVYDAALEVFVPVEADYYINTCRNNRDRARALLAEREHGHPLTNAPRSVSVKESGR